jgi:enoyl-CoA hydratase/carnithine racemase
VVLTGEGGHFAAGADLREIEGKTAAEAAADPRKAHWAAIGAFPKPWWRRWTASRWGAGSSWP